MNTYIVQRIASIYRKLIFRITHGLNDGYDCIRIDKMSVLALIDIMSNKAMENEEAIDEYISLLNAVYLANRYDDKVTLVTFITGYSRTERYFRSLKYEYIYLNEFEDPRALRKGIARYVQFYNEERPHQSLHGEKPEQIYAQITEKIAS